MADTAMAMKRKNFFMILAYYMYIFFTVMFLFCDVLD